MTINERSSETTGQILLGHIFIKILHKQIHALTMALALAIANVIAAMSSVRLYVAALMIVLENGLDAPVMHPARCARPSPVSVYS